MHPSKFDHPPTLTELCAIDAELQAAIDEFIAMLETRGTLRSIWNEPRQHFLPEAGTGIPFPTPHLYCLIFCCLQNARDCPQKEQADEEGRLNDAIGQKAQWIEILRKEFLPDYLIG